MRKRVEHEQHNIKVETYLQSVLQQQSDFRPDGQCRSKYRCLAVVFRFPQHKQTKESKAAKNEPKQAQKQMSVCVVAASYSFNTQMLVNTEGLGTASYIYSPSFAEGRVFSASMFDPLLYQVTTRNPACNSLLLLLLVLFQQFLTCLSDCFAVCVCVCVFTNICVLNE